MPTFTQGVDRFFEDPEPGTLSLVRDMLLQEHVTPGDSAALHRVFLKGGNPFLQFHAWQLMRKQPELIDSGYLQRETGLSSSAIQRVFHETCVQVRFPVVGRPGDKGRLLTAWVIPLPENELFAPSLGPDRRRSLKRVAQATGRGVFVIVDAPFTDDSFQLSITAALLAKDASIPGHLSFTGMVSPNGEIESAGYIPQKLQVCEKAGLRLIHDLQNIGQLAFWLNAPRIPVPFAWIVRWNPYTALQKMEQAIQEETPGFSLSGLRQFYGLTPEDLHHYRETPVPLEMSAWDGEIRHAASRFQLIQDAMGARSFSLVATGTLSAMMFAAGALYGRVRPSRFLQYNRETDGYAGCASAGDDEIPRLFVDSNLSGLSEALIVVHLTRQALETSVQTLADQLGLSRSLVVIKSQSPGEEIPVNRLHSYAIAIYRVLTQLRASIDVFHLVLSCPVAVGFYLGTMLDQYWKGTLHQFDPERQRYIRILNLPLKKFQERM